MLFGALGADPVQWPKMQLKTLCNFWECTGRKPFPFVTLPKCNSNQVQRAELAESQLKSKNDFTRSFGHLFVSLCGSFMCFSHPPPGPPASAASPQQFQDDPDFCPHHGLRLHHAQWWGGLENASQNPQQALLTHGKQNFYLI